ncbi:MAG: hypothetical protein QM769_06935 [Pseudoxanthomonas sp.]
MGIDADYSTVDVETEPDGSVSFIGCADDVITSSGCRIGSFDVDSAFVEYPEVQEVAVADIPDPGSAEIVKAFVKLGAGFAASDALAWELRQHVKY